MGEDGEVMFQSSGTNERGVVEGSEEVLDPR